MKRLGPAPRWVVDEYESGESARSLALRLGISPNAMGTRLRLAGATMRGNARSETQRAAARGRRPSKADETRLCDFAARGMSTREMAEIFGIGEERVRRRMVALGIPRLAAKARPEHNYFWSGGRTQDEDGYWLVKVWDHPHATATGYVREHRLVMERELGRYLEPGEVVHHRDGNHENNDPTNLEVFACNADHLRAELTGRVPNWTEDGKRRIREGVRLANQRRQAIRMASETDAQTLPLPNVPTPS
jgi:HNH endonuclease